MNTVVCIKQVPGTTHVQIDPDSATDEDSLEELIASVGGTVAETVTHSSSILVDAGEPRQSGEDTVAGWSDADKQRRERNSVVVAHENAPIADFAAVFGRPITEADQWQRVRVRGTFGTRQFLVRYRSNAGATGYEVVTPLRTASGQIVLDMPKPHVLLIGLVNIHTKQAELLLEYLESPQKYQRPGGTV